MNASLVVALVLIGGSWVMVAVALSVSTRRSALTDSAASRLAAKAAPWRAYPNNRVLFRVPSRTGPANRKILSDFSSHKDLSE